MAEVRLSDVLQTVYIWNAFVDKLKEYLPKLPDGTIVDVSNCRFDPACYKILKEHEPRLILVNRDEHVLGSALEHNRKVGSLQEQRPVKIIPYELRRGVHEVKDVAKMVSSESKDTIWRLPDNIPLNYAVVATSLYATLLLHKPGHIFDVSKSRGVSLHDVFKHFRTYLRYEHYQNEDKFYWLRGQGCMVIDFTGTKEVHVGGIGTITKELITMENVIPYWIGNEPVNKNTSPKERVELSKYIHNSVVYMDDIESKLEPTTMLAYIDRYGG